MTYVYQCKKCKRDFEIIADFSTILSIKKECPHCGSKKTIRKFVPIDFILKGKDFYKNEDKKENK